MFELLFINIKKGDCNTMQKNESAEKILDELMKNMKERKTVRKILEAKDVKSVYYKEKESLSDILTLFSREAELQCNGTEKVVFEHLPLCVNTDNIIELCFAVLMLDNLEETTLVRYWIDIVIRLRQITDGSLQEVANRFEKLFYEENQRFFSTVNEEDTLMKVAL